jgi:hypothetical protein
MRKLKAAVLAIACLVLPVTAQAQTSNGTQYQALDRPFLELLGFIEGPDGYNEITGFATSSPIKPVTSMTINEVLDYQRQLRQQGAKSSAVGRYQFVYKTLMYLTDVHGIDRNRRFDASMQDHLTRIEMERCGFYDPDTSVPELGNCLAHVWAALPLLTGPNRGKSRYRGTGINFVQTSPMIIEAVLRNRFVEYRPQTYRPQTYRSTVRATEAGFNKNDGSFPGVSAPLRAIPKDALAVTENAPMTSPRPVARETNTESVE